MNILIIGSGGREGALAWKLRQSPRVGQVFVAPGNAGTALDAQNVAIPPTDFPALIDFAKASQVDLVVVGPEAPLAAGIVEPWKMRGSGFLGLAGRRPSWNRARSFAKTCCDSAAIPTAEYQVFQNADDAVHFLREREDVPTVVKADGLAAGKGVLVCPGSARRRSRPSR